MLDSLIRFSLHQRVFVLAAAALLMILGGWQANRLPVDVFPNLNRPRVVVLTEAPGMAPEEVETLITLPLESALNGASGVETVRSSSGIGLSVIYVDFAWNSDTYADRQIVNERLQLAADKLPRNVRPTLAPVSSIMGQISMYSMWSKTGETQPMEVRTLADWVVRQRLLTISGVSQVFTMGGESKQYQVLVDPERLRNFGITLEEVHQAVSESNLNATGGYLTSNGMQEMLVRGIGRAHSISDLSEVVLSSRNQRPIKLGDVARIVEGPKTKRGDASVSFAASHNDSGAQAAVMLTINKQPGADTRRIDDEVALALRELQASLPNDIEIAAVYSQRSFIDRAIDNVVEALADGGLLVVVILFAFLLNFRTTIITLTAIPLSIVVTACVFAAFDLSINTMTLGGIAVAIGELVDDAIVDVENIHRRLQQQSRHLNFREQLEVVFRASVEIRSSVVFGTMIVVLVFLPLFALQGIEGRLFLPMALAYVVSLFASLGVSLTVTPALSSLLLLSKRSGIWIAPALAVALAFVSVFWLLPRVLESMSMQMPGPSACIIMALFLSPVLWLLISIAERHAPDAKNHSGPIVRIGQAVSAALVRFSVRHAKWILGGSVVCVAIASMVLLSMERDFLPPFNEGTVQVNVLLPPGTSLAANNQLAESIQEQLVKIPEVNSAARRTGRAELDEHAEGVNVSEFVLNIDPKANRESTLHKVRDVLSDFPGIASTTEQPLAHMISHMLSGVKAQIGIKIYGDNLSLLKSKAGELEQLILDVPGLTDVMVEQQANVPQLRIEIDRPALALHGIRPSHLMEMLETAMNGKVVGQILEGPRSFDLLIRMDEPYREDVESLGRLPVTLSDGSVVPLDSLARIYESYGPNVINRENVRRRIVVQGNVVERGVVDVVDEIKERLAQMELPPGYFLEYGGQFESQESAVKRLALLSIVSAIGVILVLYSLFGSMNFSLQVLAAIPTAFVGAVIALLITHQNLSIAAIVGFISLCGIATRNGILLLNHYVHLAKHEGATWNQDLLIRAGKERMTPVMMTALTSGIGLLPLAAAAGAPGKEILYPVATVIVGGLTTCTFAEFLVRPALFSLFGFNAGMRLCGREEGEPKSNANSVVPAPHIQNSSRSSVVT